MMEVKYLAADAHPEVLAGYQALAKHMPKSCMI